jgi:hypothetical protein
MPPVMAMPGKGEGPFQIPFGSAWRASRRGTAFFLEMRRGDAGAWGSEGWFASRREAKRAARDLARRHPDAEFRIRETTRPTAS